MDGAPKPTATLGANDPQLWYGAGLAEGRLSAARIFQHYNNTMIPNLPIPAPVLAWIATHVAWVQEQVLLNSPTDPFWAQTGRTLAQLQGLTDGYNAVMASTMPLTFIDLYVVNFGAELGDVSTALGFHAKNPYPMLHCSGIVKATSDDLYMAHTTWSGYNMMLRIYKDYDFGAVRVAFSSYPTAWTTGTC